MRLKSNHYACRIALKRLKSAVDENDNHEVYAGIGELLLWVITTEEWHLKYNNQSNKYRQEKNTSESGLIVYGLRHAHNMVKHNMQFFQIFNKSGRTSFNSSTFNTTKINQSVEYRWMYAKNVLDTDDSKEVQIQNYIKYIQNKEIIGTFDRAITFLSKVSYPFLIGEHDM